MTRDEANQVISSFRQEIIRNNIKGVDGIRLITDRENPERAKLRIGLTINNTLEQVTLALKSTFSRVLGREMEAGDFEFENVRTLSH